MRVSFLRESGRRYAVAIEREHRPALRSRVAPGYDDALPHDLGHFLVEEWCGIRLGVFGQLASGGAGIFRPAPADDTTRHRRTARRLAEVGRPDVERSERLTQLVVTAWLREGPVDLDALAGAGVRDPAGLLRRLDELSARWRATAPGEALVLDWPRHLVFDSAGSPAGRRQSRERHRAR